MPLTTELEKKIRETHAGVLVLREWRVHLNGSVAELKERVSDHEDRIQNVEGTLSTTAPTPAPGRWPTPL